jgi:hypothetical protein
MYKGGQKKKKFPYKIKTENLDSPLEDHISSSSLYSLSPSDTNSAKASVCQECKRKRKKSATPELTKDHK